MGVVRGGARLAAVVAALAVGASYGLGGVVNQVITAQGISVLNLTVYQFAVATVVLGLLTACFFRDRLSLKEILQLCCIGVFCAGASVCYFLAIDMLTVGQAVSIQFQYVWMAVVVQCVAERLVPNKYVVFSIVLVVIGSAMGSGLVDELLSQGASFSVAGALFGIACAVCQALFIYLNSRVALDKKPVPRTFVVVASGLVVMLFVSPDFLARFSEMLAFLSGGIVMGLVVSVLPCLCLAFASSRLDGGLIAILTSVELPVAVGAGALVLGETVTPLGVAGVCLIVGSIVISQVKGRFSSKGSVSECASAHN